MWQELIYWVFALSTAIQLFFWLYFFGKLAVYQETKPATSTYKPHTTPSSGASSHEHQTDKACRFHRHLRA
ncbi:MAG: hypothetical protein KatS3mg029_0781 [Saprospiraceae bacterium]|nr:MAG: hypothetical protein KatS3mg029_0781 [Saprospiraceae bacterium]